MFSWGQLGIVVVICIAIMTCDIIIIKSIKALTTTLQFILNELEEYRRKQ